MIADGDATLVVDARSIVTLAAPDGSDTRPKAPRHRTDGLRPEQLRVVEALPARGAITVDEIAFTSGLTVNEVLRALAALDLSGHVVETAGAWGLASL